MRRTSSSTGKARPASAPRPVPSANPTENVNPRGSQLRDAELKQLAQYVRNRSSKLDEEIHRLQKKLRGTPSGVKQQSIGWLDASGMIEEHTEEEKSRVTADKRSPPMAITGVGLGKGRASSAALMGDESQNVPPVKNAAPNPSQSRRSKEPNHLIDLLARLKLRAEDSEFTSEEIVELLLPSSIYRRNESHVSLSEVTSVLQVDLAMPLTTQDQAILLKEYGNERGQIDVKMMLSDAGVIDQGSTPSPEGRKTMTASSSSPERPKSGAARGRSIRSHSSDEEELFLQTSQTLAELQQLHTIIEEEMDDVTAPTQASKEGKKEGQRDRQMRDKQMVADAVDAETRFDMSTSSAPDKVAPEPRGREDLPLPLSDQQRLKLLELENKKLRQEMKAFDSEFFEQLEDLKFRYAKLQEVVGEDPTGPEEGLDSALRKKDLPLNKLAWSVRNAMTAIDRASYHSPIVADVLQEDGESLLLGPSPDQKYRSGGHHGIGDGKYRSTIDSTIGDLGGTYANLCERRLVFEIANHAAPYKAIRTLIARAKDIGERNRAANKSDGLFILVPQLYAVLIEAGLQLSSQEVDLLATGFASDGKGGIDVVEFCDMVQNLAYNVIGEHALVNQTKKEEKASSKGVLSTELEHGRIKSKETLQLMQEVCESILTYDKKAVLEANMFQGLLKAFVERDLDGKGVVPFCDFQRSLNDLGAMLSREEYRLIAMSYVLEGTKAPSSYPSAQLDHIQSFREAKLTGSLSGKSKTSQRFGDFLSNNYIHLHDDRQQEEVAEDSMIEYPAFVKDLVDILEQMIDAKGGIPMKKNLDWVIKEFEFVDFLISQLEAMKPNVRRKCLIALQYALEHADQRKSGELDGFAILTALINAGFHLQRYQRVQLLRAAEEYGGLLEYERLITILLRTMGDWTVTERSLVFKILKAMGTSVEERRNWLSRCKKALLERAAQRSLQTKVKEKLGSRAMKSARTAATLDSSQNAPGGDNHHSAEMMSIAPSLFLHILRELHVQLTPEEEATLLDCLDTERLIKARGEQALSKSQAKHLSSSASQRKALELWNDDTFRLPVVDYQSFIAFCARHCGSWIDSHPALYETISQNVASLHYPIAALQEFLTLLRSFDDEKRGFVSQRAFLVCCHRTRLFTQAQDQDLQRLADILVVEGAGEIEYFSFILTLRGVCSAAQQQQQRSREHTESILAQLLANSTNAEGCLYPLRNWLLLHTDIKSLIMNLREVNALLREFSVVYRAEDMEWLLIEVGREVSAAPDAVNMTASLNLPKYVMSKAEETHVRVVDTRRFLGALMRLRRPWTERNPRLVRELLRALYKSYYGEENSETKQVKSGDMQLIVQKVLSRVEAFSDREEDDVVMDGNVLYTKHSGPTRGRRLIEAHVFDYLLRSMQIHLAPADLQFLSDASDVYPEAQLIDAYLLLDLLSMNPTTGEALSAADESPQLTEGLSEACIHALKHLQTMLWKTAPINNVERLSGNGKKQTAMLQWVADVKCLFQGFDVFDQGLIAFEDFTMALRLLQVTMSTELLMDLQPLVGANPSHPVQYRRILSLILTAPGDSSLGFSPQDPDQLTVKVPKTQLKLAPAKEAPVSRLLKVVRKAVCRFILQDHSLEDAWVEILRVFQRFDATQSNFVSPRDFCLAVQVLIGDEDVLLTKAEWEQIIEFFLPDAAGAGAAVKAKSRPVADVKVDYMLFCEMVLEPTQLQKRLDAERRSDLSEQRIDKGKRLLSKPVHKKDKEKPAGDGEKPTASGKQMSTDDVKRTFDPKLVDRLMASQERHKQRLARGREYNARSADDDGDGAGKKNPAVYGRHSQPMIRPLLEYDDHMQEVLSAKRDTLREEAWTAKRPTEKPNKTALVPSSSAMRFGGGEVANKQRKGRVSFNWTTHT